MNNRSNIRNITDKDRRIVKTATAAAVRKSASPEKVTIF
jgi:hypothetical protein